MLVLELELELVALPAWVVLLVRPVVYGLEGLYGCWFVFIQFFVDIYKLTRWKNCHQRSSSE